MPLHPIEKVVVAGASGAVGIAVVQALLDAHFQVSVLTRPSSNKSFPTSVEVIETDYTYDSLIRAFHSQHAVVSALASASTGMQQTIVDAAIASSVRHFLPSEYGVDSSSETVTAVLPGLKAKVAVTNYLKAREDKIAWSALITGCLFDWCFDHAPLGGWNFANKTATVYDGGDVPFEATNMSQLGHAVVAILRNPDLTANQYVFINSFTTTQNQVIESFEKAGSGKWAVTHARTDSTWQEGTEVLQKGGPGSILGMFSIITAAYYGHGGVNFYSAKPGLWNERLGLPVEDLDKATATIVAEARSSI